MLPCRVKCHPPPSWDLREQHVGNTVGVVGDFYAFREMPPEARLANEFAFIHRVVLQETAGGEEIPDTAAE